MSEPTAIVITGDAGSADAVAMPPAQSPPPAAQPARQSDDPRSRLHDLLRELVRTRNRRVMLEYLRLRRAVR